MGKPRTILVAAGELRDGESLKQFVGPESRVIAVDGGLAHLRAVGHSPDFVLGDIDSATKEDLEWARAQGAELIHLSEQEDSDLAKAFTFCSERGWRLIDVVGVEGGRSDHQFAVYAALATADDSLSITLHLDNGVAHRLAKAESTGGEATFSPEGEFSLFALKRAKISLTGAEYELEDEWLELDTRGLSNHSTEMIRVDLHEGGPILLFLKG
jgi:thiamine pyrophosphokinase